jgi:hypothetical protein
MLVKRFKGRVVKNMRRVPSGILLTLLARTPGQRGTQIVVTQAEWDQFGSESYEKGVTLAMLRRSQPAE